MSAENSTSASAFGARLKSPVALTAYPKPIEFKTKSFLIILPLPVASLRSLAGCPGQCARSL